MAAQVDVKVSRGDTTRRFKLPLTPCPSWSALSGLAKARHGVPEGERIALTYIDREGEQVTISSDEEVADMWPRKPEGVDVQSYVDQLAPLSFKVIPLPQWQASVDDVAESFEKVTIDEIKDKSDTFSVKDATEATPDVEVEEEKQERGPQEKTGRQQEEEAQDPPEVPLENEGQGNVPPVIALTRGIVDFLEIGLGRISMDSTTRAASNNVLEAVATVGLELDSLINSARRAGEDLMSAVAAERRQREERDGQQASEGPRGTSDETANARRVPSYTAAGPVSDTAAPFARPPSPVRAPRPATFDEPPLHRPRHTFGAPPAFAAPWQRPAPYPMHPSAFTRHAHTEVDPLAPPRNDWGPSPFAGRRGRDGIGLHSAQAAARAEAMLNNIRSFDPYQGRTTLATPSTGRMPPTGPFCPPSPPEF